TELTLNFRDVSTERIQSAFEESEFGSEKNFDFADYDLDGDLDVVVAVQWSDFGNRRNKLYRNDNGILIDVAGTNVMPEFEIGDNSCTALFRDFDQDGLPDIIMVCDSNSGSVTDISPGKTKFYRNINGTHFLNESYRLNDLVSAASFAAAADFDNNGFLDIAISGHPNINQDKISFNAINGNLAGEFSELTSTHMPPDNEYGKHMAAADMNGDGKIDILMASHAAADSFIYYNNNNDAGSGDGDFQYSDPGAIYEFDPAGSGIRERAIVPGDFNNDGLMDLYVGNAGGFEGTLSDAIFVNVGNDSTNRAIFEPQGTVTGLGTETMKITVSDVDQDGKEDLIVMGENRRPYLLRNTSENSAVSFVDWTHPALNEMTHEGWEAAAGQLTGDERLDLIVGGVQGDYLFEGIESELLEIDDEPLVLPEFHAQNPIAALGRLPVGGTQLIVTTPLPAGAQVSVLLRSYGDLSVKATINGVEVACSDVTGHGSDEAFQFTMPINGSVLFEVSSHAISFDGNGDGIVNLLDVGPFIDCLSGNSNNCEPYDLFDNGVLNLTLVDPFVEAISKLKTEEEFVIEFLSR
ncbi:MAG: VCBS repeat-containing protein, partial [Planctomycetota bacterium]